MTHLPNSKVPAVKGGQSGLAWAKVGSFPPSPPREAMGEGSNQPGSNHLGWSDGEGCGLGSPLPPSTEPLSPPAPGPGARVPASSRTPHPSPGRGHLPERRIFRRPGESHLGLQGVEELIRAVGTVTPDSAPEPRPGPASDTASGLAGSPGTGLRRGRLGPAPSRSGPAGSPICQSACSPPPRPTSALPAGPGPPSRSAPLPSAALSSTPRTSARLLGVRAAWVSEAILWRTGAGLRACARAWGRPGRGCRENGVYRGSGQARRADVKQAAAVGAGEFATFAVSRKQVRESGITVVTAYSHLQKYQPESRKLLFQCSMYNKISPQSPPPPIEWCILVRHLTRPVLFLQQSR